jgi:hypothetical protein
LILYNLFTEGAILFFMMISSPVRCNIIKALTFIIFLITTVMLLNNCEKEKAVARSYPRLSGMSVTNITEHGAFLNAEIYSLGTEKISEHGFVWGITDPNVSYSNRIMLGPCDNEGAFSAEINSTLKKEVKYTVKPFVQTKDHIVYGIPIVFKSLGSEAPVIYGFEPDSAGWMDTLTIKGKNFSWVASENVVKLNNTICSHLGSTDSTLKVIVSSELPDLKAILSVELAGNLASYTKDTFRLIIPVIHDFYPKQACWGDTITVTGKGFLNDRFNFAISAAIGASSSGIIERENESIKFLVPLELASAENLLTIKMQDLIFPLSDKFILTPPYISKIEPTEGTWGTIVTIMGKFHPVSSKNGIKIGEYVVPLISFNKDSIKVAVPQNLDSHYNLIVNTSSPFTVVSPDTFKLFGPRIDSITPMAGVSNSTVSIMGNYFLRGNNYPQVKFGSINATVVGIRPTRIDFSVPYPMNNGPVIITVTVGSQSKVYDKPFTVRNPVIKKVYPLTGTFNEEVTIEGENLLVNSSNMKVFFAAGELSEIANIVTATQNKVVVKVPWYLDSIPRNIVMNYSYKMGFFSSEKFVLSPPEITSITPSVITSAGIDIVISGSNFHPNVYINEVYWDIYPLTIKSGTVSRLVASLPVSMPRINGNILVITGGYKRSFPITNLTKSYWNRTPIPPSFIWAPGAGLNQNGISFSIGGTGYMMDYSTGNMTSFSPSTNEFRNLGTFSTFYQAQGMALAVNRDTAYMLSASKGLFRYDVTTNSWVSIGTSPTSERDGVAFFLNNILYFGLINDYTKPTIGKPLWIYNFKNKTWTLKNNFPEITSEFVVSSFVIDNKEYILFSNNKFWRYDPDTNKWTAMAPFPQASPWIINKVGFALNNKAYVGLGSTSTGDLWMYDPTIDTWTGYTSIPGGTRYCAISYVINSKAYLGFGFHGSTRVRDFYEFDPNYPLK